MSWIAVAIGGGALIGGLASMQGSNAQASAAQNASNQQWQMFNTINSNEAPYQQQGKTSLGQLGGYLNANQAGGPGGQPGLLSSFNAQDLNANLAPNYQFQLGQGMGQLQNQNAATGGAGGGNAFTGEQAYAQNTAASAYQNAFNNFQTNQGNIYSRLGTLAQLGQAAGTNSALGGSAFGANAANATIGVGNAQASGYTGVGNAVSGGVNNALGYYTMNNLISGNSLNNQFANAGSSGLGGL